MRLPEKTYVLAIPLILRFALLQAQPPARPFPQHISYSRDIILPDQYSRGQLDDSVASFYKAWKNRYIRRGCGPGQSYVWFEGSSSQKRSVSEAQGYGMIITAMMAGYDDSAETIYNELFHYCRAHPAKTDPSLMAWAQLKGCRDLDETTASDGDMDIAYSLVLADAQWGSRGAVNYLEEARHMIKSILKQEINHKIFSVLLSDAIEPDSKDYADMRSSDYMPAHFRLFGKLSGDSAWKKAIDNNYRLFGYMQKTYSPEAGLMPDFITHIHASADQDASAGAPARPHYLESRYDGRYYYNACRVPWRIAEDYILNGDQRAAGFVEKINHWIRSTTKGDPDNISAGYSLDGNDLPHHYFEALSFIVPFAISGMVNRDHNPEARVWLNKLWKYIVDFRLRQFDYYDNSIKMIGLIILSGNYWAP
jgi:hypothetical protein